MTQEPIDRATELRAKGLTREQVSEIPAGKKWCLCDLLDGRHWVQMPLHYDATKVTTSDLCVDPQLWTVSRVVDLQAAELGWAHVCLVEDLRDLGPTPRQHREIMQGRYGSKAIDLFFERACQRIEQEWVNADVLHQPSITRLARPVCAAHETFLAKHGISPEKLQFEGASSPEGKILHCPGKSLGIACASVLSQHWTDFVENGLDASALVYLQDGKPKQVRVFKDHDESLQTSWPTTRKVLSYYGWELKHPLADWQIRTHDYLGYYVVDLLERTDWISKEMP